MSFGNLAGTLVGSNDTLLGGVSDPKEWKILGSIVEPPSQNSQLQSAAATWLLETRSDSAFSQINLDFFSFASQVINDRSDVMLDTTARDTWLCCYKHCRLLTRWSC